MALTRWKMSVEYKGTRYSGWQRQDNAPSVQQHIEEAIFKFSGQEVRIHAAGRTDAGVHACGQVIHVDLEGFSKPMAGFEVAKAINAYLRAQDIAVIKAHPVSDDFHARFSAVNKLYRYRIINRSAPPVIECGLVWHVRKPLDIMAMRAGAEHLLGHHDFTTFRATECQSKTPFKTLDRIEIFSRPCEIADGQVIDVEVEGRSFLHHQVRNMVGTLSLVGEGKWQPEDVKTALEARDRKMGGPTAPADGLYLVRVDYP